MRTNTVSRAAALWVGLEGVALAALVVWQVAAIVSGDSESLESAIALTVLTVATAAAVLVFAAATWRGQSWGRSGAIVTQVLILGIALGAATGVYAQPSTAIILAIPGIIGLVLLVLAVRDAGRGGGDAASG